MARTIDTRLRFDDGIESLLHHIAKEQGFKNYRIQESPNYAKRSGLFGYVTAVYISEETSSQKEKTLHLVVKCASESDSVRTELSISSYYGHEVHMYNNVIPNFQRFEEAKGTSTFSSTPKCFKTCMIEKHESLILENLIESGYNLWETPKPMDHDHVSLIIEELAHFHAISYALKDQQPDNFKKLIENNMNDIYIAAMIKVGFIKVFENQCIKAVKALDPVNDKKAYDVFKQFTYEVVVKFMTNLANHVDNYSVILHGDVWSNNIMFKYKNERNSKVPTEVRLIDFQISRLGSPVLDLSYFLCGCSSKEVIDKLEYYLDMYYNTLSKHLQMLGTDSEKIYPNSIFLEQWKKYSKFGLVTSMLLLHIMLTDEKDLAGFAEVSDSGKKICDAFNYDISNIEEYNERARYIILHFVNNDLI